MILSLHRSNLFPGSETEATADASGKATGAGELNQVSLHICAQALRRITRAQQTMIDVLGRTRATMFWKIATTPTRPPSLEPTSCLFTRRASMQSRRWRIWRL